MGGYFSEISFQPNDIEQARLKRLESGAPLIDLTSTNPLTEDLLFPGEILSAPCISYFGKRHYVPSPKGLASAREAIASYYATRAVSLKVDPENIYITASSSESFRLLFSLLCNPGDNILVPNISYPLLELIAADQRIELRSYVLDRNQAAWSIRAGSLDAAIDARTKAIVVTSPHNPTGWALAPVEEQLINRHLPLISDEVFLEFPINGFPIPSIGNLRANSPVFLLNGISKMLALPDLKISWIVLNDICSELYGTKLEFLNDIYLSANSLSQSLLPSALSVKTTVAENILHRIRENLAFAENALRANPHIRVLSPTAGWSLMLLCNDGRDEEALVLQLIDAGVLVHPGYFYSCESDSYLVLSLIVRPDVFRQGILKLAETIA